MKEAFRLFHGLKQDGLDCGDDVSSFLKAVLESDSNLRLIHYVDGLYSERDVVSKEEWLLGNVPRRHDRVGFSLYLFLDEILS